MPNSDDQQLIQKFKNAREQAIKIWLEYHAKKIDDDELRTQLRQCMFLDDKNTWWATGIEQDTWYKFIDGDWDLTPLPFSISTDEALEAAITEIAYLYKPIVINDTIHIQLEIYELHDPSEVQLMPSNFWPSDEELERESKEARRQVLEEERQQKNQKSAPNEA